MRIISLTIALYGTDYLKYALQSVNPAVDAQYVLYTPQGSHGHRTDAVCPDTREQLIECAIEGAGDKLRWHEGVYANESDHRAKIFELEPDADVIIVVDSDEIYADGLAEDVIRYSYPNKERKHFPGGDRRLRLPFIHLWRSFKRGFAHDPAFPERVICPLYPNSVSTMPTDKCIWHFGYAQRSEIVRYKLETHGHKAEFRRDVDWFADVFMANRQTDCHPVGSDAWNCEDMDASALPSVLSDHPFKDLEVIP